MPSLSSLHRVAYQARSPDWQSHLNCGSINSEIRRELNETFGDIASIAIGEFARAPRRRFGAEHAWVIIPATHTAENVPVIIDGSLDQFCIEKYENGYVPIGLRPVEEFPSRVAVIAQNDTYNTRITTGLYDHFIEKQRYGPGETVTEF